MAKVGYIRALEDAAIKKQEENLTASGCEKLFSDRAGLRSPRPNWDKLLEYLRTGDVLVVTELASMARTLKHFYKQVKEFETRGIGLISLQDGINTLENSGCFFTVVSAISRLEKTLKSESDSTAEPAPVRRGKSTGRPPLPQELLANAAHMFRTSGKRADEVAKEFNISRRVLFKYLKANESLSE